MVLDIYAYLECGGREGMYMPSHAILYSQPRGEIKGLGGILLTVSVSEPVLWRRLVGSGGRLI